MKIQFLSTGGTFSVDIWVGEVAAGCAASTVSSDGTIRYPWSCDSYTTADARIVYSYIQILQIRISGEEEGG